jgi:hypothetical protein
MAKRSVFLFAGFIFCGLIFCTPRLRWHRAGRFGRMREDCPGAFY